jgi:hypothetical protein
LLPVAMWCHHLDNTYFSVLLPVTMWCNHLVNTYFSVVVVLQATKH